MGYSNVLLLWSFGAGHLMSHIYLYTGVLTVINNAAFYVTYGLDLERVIPKFLSTVIYTYTAGHVDDANSVYSDAESCVLSKRSFHFQFQPSENEMIVIRVLMEAEERMLNLPPQDFVIEDKGIYIYKGK